MGQIFFVTLGVVKIFQTILNTMYNDISLNISSSFLNFYYGSKRLEETRKQYASD